MAAPGDTRSDRSAPARHNRTLSPPPRCARSTRKVPSELGRWDLLRLPLPSWRGHLASAIVAWAGEDSRVVSHQHPQLHAGARTGVWCATKLATDAGGWRQINRAGHPMMWPIFWPDDTNFSNPANDRHPSADFNAESKHIGDLVAAVVSASGTSDDPQGYGETVARALFPDVLSYVIGTPATYGFAVRNGRTLAGNAPEVMLSVVLNTAVTSGLKPSVSGRLRASPNRELPVCRGGVTRWDSRAHNAIAPRLAAVTTRPKAQ